MEHIGVLRLYELALNFEMFEESDLHHLEWCKECLEVFKAISEYNRFNTEGIQRQLLTMSDLVS